MGKEKIGLPSRERSCIHWLIPQMVAISGARSGQSQELHLGRRVYIFIHRYEVGRSFLEVPQGMSLQVTLSRFGFLPITGSLITGKGHAVIMTSWCCKVCVCGKLPF